MFIASELRLYIEPEEVFTCKQVAIFDVVLDLCMPPNRPIEWLLETAGFIESCCCTFICGCGGRVRSGGEEAVSFESCANWADSDVVDVCDSGGDRGASDSAMSRVATLATVASVCLHKAAIVSFVLGFSLRLLVETWNFFELDLDEAFESFGVFDLFKKYELPP